ncbi:MAG: NAD-dependent epimerase/dehydratase family protein [Saprospiraceae bacterium]
MTRVLVTGATGFVGRQIMRTLAASDVALIPVVRSGKEGFVNTLRGVERVVLSPDIFAEPEDWWVEQCQGVDLVIHAAWYAEPGKYLQAPQNMQCLTGSLTLAKGAVKAGVRRFVGIGTCFEYDLTQGVLSVHTPLNPLSPYAAAKAALFFGLSQWLPTQSIEFTWCRLFYLYGEGEDERRLVPYIHKQIQKGEPVELTSGKQIRDYMDVSDAAKKIVEFALCPQTGPVNICSGVSVTVRQLAEQIANQYGRQDLLRFGVRPDNPVDPVCVLGIPGTLN